MILVTGATGFVGRRFAKLLVKEFDKKEILCLVRKYDSPLESSGRENLRHLGLKMKYVDLVSCEGLEQLSPAPRVIFYLAANTEVLDHDHKINEVGITNLLGALENLGRRDLVLYVSTLVIYSGKLETFHPIAESTIPSPTNEYSRTKWIGEQALVKLCRKKKFRLSIIRPNTIYGKGGRENGLFDAMEKMVENNSILARLNWPGRSSLVYVGDVARALIEIANKPGKPGVPELFTLSPEELTLADISKLIFESKKLKYSPIKLPSVFWKLLCEFRPIIYKLENVLSVKLYNWLWRLSLVVEDVIVCKSDLFRKTFPKFKFVKLKDKIQEISS